MQPFLQPESDDHARAIVEKYAHSMTHVQHVTLDSQGLVNIQGDVSFREPPFKGDKILHQLPMRFGKISGSFAARNLELITLEGAPHTVTGTFNVGGNQLTDLTNGPNLAQGIYQAANNPLISLKGLPDHGVQYFFCTYHNQLPLLRLLQVQDVELRLNFPPVSLMHIIKKHVGKGKAHMLNFALELKQAGYTENAKW